jgi:D-alanyl-D-alanine carboxypeptidase
MLMRATTIWLMAVIAPCMLACAAPRGHEEAARQLESRVDTEARSQMARGNIPGAAIAVLRNGKPLYVKSYGKSNLELDVPVTDGSVFELASLTKQFTAAAVLLLAHEGKLSLDDPIEKYIEKPPAHWAGVTVQHLLSHSAGLEHRFEKSIDGSLLLDYSTESLLISAKATPGFAPPGKRFRYSDQGYFLLGLIIEHVEKSSFAEFLSKRFFVPLGMRHTTVQDQSRILPNRVAGYTVKNGAWENIRRAWQFGLTSHFGVLSTIEDMTKWEQSLWTGQVLPASVLQRIWQPLHVFRRDDARGELLAYGYGWWVISGDGHRVIEHSGFQGSR